MVRLKKIHFSHKVLISSFLANRPRYRIVLILGLLTGATAAPLSGGPGPNALERDLDAIAGRHPAVVGAMAAWRAAARSGRYAGRIYPDPEIMVMGERGSARDLMVFPEPDYTSRTATATEYRITQAIPFPGRYSTTAAALRLEAELKRIEVAETRNRIVREYLERRIQERSAAATLALTRGFERRIGNLAATAGARNAAGLGSISDAAMARVRQGGFHDRALELEGRLRALGAEFAYFISESEKANHTTGDHSGPTTGNVPPGDLTALLARIEERAVERSREPERFALDVARGRIEAARAEKEQTLARLEYGPDFSVFAGYREENATPGLPRAGIGVDRAVSAGLTVRLPLWSAIAGTARLSGARERRENARSLLEDAIRRNLSEVRAAHLEHDSHRKRVLLFRAAQVPRALIAREAALVAYRAGRADFTAVLATWDDLYAAETELIRLEELRDMHLLNLSALVDALLPASMPDQGEEDR